MACGGKCLTLHDVALGSQVIDHEEIGLVLRVGGESGESSRHLSVGDDIGGRDGLQVIGRGGLGGCAIAFL